MATVCSFLFGHELFHCIRWSMACILGSILSMLFYFWTGIDLNLPLDEFGAVDFDYLHNPHGKHAYIYIMLFFLSMYRFLYLFHSLSTIKMLVVVLYFDHAVTTITTMNMLVFFPYK